MLDFWITAGMVASMLAVVVPFALVVARYVRVDLRSLTRTSAMIVYMGLCLALDVAAWLSFATFTLQTMGIRTLDGHETTTGVVIMVWFFMVAAMALPIQFNGTDALLDWIDDRFRAH